MAACLTFGCRSSIDLPSLSPVEEDVFSCGGDLELEKEGTRLLHGSAQLEPPGSSGDRSSQFKIGIHPSRTLLVSNISSTISDEHLKALFEVIATSHFLFFFGEAEGILNTVSSGSFTGAVVGCCVNSRSALTGCLLGIFEVAAAVFLS